MIYDFNKPLDRSRNSSIKYDNRKSKFGREDVIPLWIADMDIPVAQPIIDAVVDRAKQGVYGYTTRPQSYHEAVQSWQKKRNNWEPDVSLMSFAMGVVPAINAIIYQFSEEKDSILFFTPVYPHFFTSVENTGRHLLTSGLIEKDGYYTVDFENFEEQLKKGPKILILCSPHNPVGRVWTADELKRIGDLCVKYNVLVLADEIHSDLVLFGNKHIPLATISPEISDITITCISSTKTFNLAGLHASTIISPNMEAKAKFDDFWGKLDLGSNNCFSQVAVEVAFREGADWLDQVLRHIESNTLYARNYLEKHIPEIKFWVPESTYLLWLDCRQLGMNATELNSFMINKAGLGLNNGIDFGKEGEGFMRMNIACPLPQLEEALEQLKAAVSEIR